MIPKTAELVLAKGGEWFHVQGHDYSMYIAILPCKITTPHELNGLVANIGAKRYRVKGVELFMHAAPWSEGEQCAFALESL